MRHPFQALTTRPSFASRASRATAVLACLAAIAACSLAAPAGADASTGSVSVRVESHGWKGTAFYTYLSQDAVRYVARRGPEAGYVLCGFVAARFGYAGAACAAVVFLYGDWFTKQARSAANRGCIRIMTIKNSPLAWQRSGFWVPPRNLGSSWSALDWTKVAITVVPNAGPGGYCREH